MPLDKRETGYYPGFDPNGTRPKDPSGLEPPTMRGPDPPDKKCRMCDRDIPDPSKIGECKICMKRACEICIPKATRLCPVCALSIGSSQVPQHLFGTGGGGCSSHHDPNCTAATKCIAIDLPPEPDAAGLRVWIANMKEAVSNAYSYDGLYVINWLTEVEKAKTFDELDGECKYHILEARFNAAIRKCIKTVAIIDKINRLTEAAQRSNNRIKSRQILWLLYDHLRTANIGEQSFRIIELSNLRCSVSSFYTEEERLERFIAKWDHILAGLDEPLTEQVKRSLFSEKVRSGSVTGTFFTQVLFERETILTNVTSASLAVKLSHEMIVSITYVFTSGFTRVARVPTGSTLLPPSSWALPVWRRRWRRIIIRRARWRWPLIRITGRGTP